MKKKAIDYQILFKKKFTSLNKSEQEELNLWLKERKHRNHYSKFISNKSRTVTTESAQKSWDKIDQRISHNRYKKIFIYTSISSIAVALLIAFIYSWNINKESNQTLETVPGNNYVELVLDKNKTIVLNNTSNKTINTLSSHITYNKKQIQLETKKNNAPAKLKTNTIKVPKGGEYTITLSDGTIVKLNSASQMTFPTYFKEKNREVDIKGEAFFKVKHDKNHPFIVHTNKQNITVLGTSFNVNTFGISEKTTLVKGSIALSTNNDSPKIILKPGDQAQIAPNSKPQIKQVNVRFACDWINGKLSFNEETLLDISRTLSRWYNTEFVFENKCKEQIKFTGSLRRYDTLEKVLTILENTEEIQYTCKGSTVYIY